MASDEIVTSNLGIIMKLAYKYWRMLPPAVMAHFDVEDMISEIVTHVVKVSYAYHKRRGMSSTFVWKVAENHCKVILQKYSTKKRRAFQVLPEEVLATMSAPDSILKLTEARHGVEQVIRFASDNLRRALSDLLEGGDLFSLKYNRAAREELRELAHVHHVSFNDFCLVMGRMA